MATITKTINDVMGLSDRIAKTRTKIKNEILGPSDIVGKERTKVKSDTLGVAGSNLINKSSFYSDSVGLAESFKVLPSTTRHYDDVGLTDSDTTVQLALQLIVTPIDGAGIVSVQLIMNEFYGFTKFSIERVNTATGTVTPVRGGEYQDAGFSTLDVTLYDAECPLSTPDDIGAACYYIATGYITNTSGTIYEDMTVQHISDSFNLHDSVGAAWIKNPGVNAGVQSANNKFLMDHMDNFTYRTRVLATTNVLGRRLPIIVTDVLGGREGTMYIASYPEAENIYGYAWQRSDILGLIAFGDTLFFQTTGDIGIDDFFFKITGDVQENQLNAGSPVSPDRIWTIPFTEVDAPESNVVNGSTTDATWLEVATNWASWQNVLESHDTWQDVLING